MGISFAKRQQEEDHTKKQTEEIITLHQLSHALALCLLCPLKNSQRRETEVASTSRLLSEVVNYHTFIKTKKFFSDFSPESLYIP